MICNQGAPRKYIENEMYIFKNVTYNIKHQKKN